MSTTVIIRERVYKTKQRARQMAAQYVDDGYTVEGPVEEADGDWLLRIFPKDYGEVAAGTNPGIETAGIEAGAPVTPGEGGVKVLLDYIAGLESNGNYNAYFRHADNHDSPSFTAMTLADVLVWQKQQVKAGSLSSAVGRYQIIRGTLEALIKSMGLDAPRAKFDVATQDRMAIKLLEARGLKDLLAGTTTAQAFANSVSREWAALPIVTNNFPDNKGRLNRKGASYYAGDGVNKAHAGPYTYLRAVDTIVA
ncbi:MAG: hypothetical protein ACI9DC_004603 [Gammaproteobacteria bacterium]|jgi:hypothetical protein